MTGSTGDLTAVSDRSSEVVFRRTAEGGSHPWPPLSHGNEVGVLVLVIASVASIGIRSRSVNMMSL